MKDFEVAKTILLNIVEKEIPFAIALRNAYRKQTIEAQSRSNITALIGCELRHHYILDNLLNRYSAEDVFAHTIYTRFLVANKLFLRRFSDDELYQLAISEMNKEEVDEILAFVSSTTEIIPSELDKTSPEYLSLRFNTPAWVIRMWQKQFGRNLIFKVLKTNYRQSIPCLRVNNSLVTKEQMLGKYPDLSSSPVEDILVYHGRGMPRGFEEFKTNALFSMKMATKYMLDQIELDPLKGIALYSDNPNNIYLDLVSRFGKDVSLDLIIHHAQSYFDTKRMVEISGYNNIRVYEAASSSLITCLSNKVKTMLCLPKSTAFDNLRSSPDYFLRVRQDELDELIANELASLEECANFVEDDGSLVYMVPTISKKESTNLIVTFLFNHPNYKLVEERQFFPFEAFDSCLYYAIMKKTGE